MEGGVKGVVDWLLVFSSASHWQLCPVEHPKHDKNMRKGTFLLSNFALGVFFVFVCVFLCRWSFKNYETHECRLNVPWLSSMKQTNFLCFGLFSCHLSGKGKKQRQRSNDLWVDCGFLPWEKQSPEKTGKDGRWVGRREMGEMGMFCFVRPTFEWILFLGEDGRWQVGPYCCADGWHENRVPGCLKMGATRHRQGGQPL